MKNSNGDDTVVRMLSQVQGLLNRQPNGVRESREADAEPEDPIEREHEAGGENLDITPPEKARRARMRDLLGQAPAADEADQAESGEVPAFDVGRPEAPEEADLPAFDIDGAEALEVEDVPAFEIDSPKTPEGDDVPQVQEQEDVPGFGIDRPEILEEANVRAFDIDQPQAIEEADAPAFDIGHPEAIEEADVPAADVYPPEATEEKEVTAFEIATPRASDVAVPLAGAMGVDDRAQTTPEVDIYDLGGESADAEVPDPGVPPDDMNVHDPASTASDVDTYDPDATEPDMEAYDPAPAEPDVEAYEPTPAQPDTETREPAPAEPAVEHQVPDPAGVVFGLQEPATGPAIQRPSPAEPVFELEEHTPAEPVMELQEPTPTQPVMQTREPSPEDPVVEPSPLSDYAAGEPHDEARLTRRLTTRLGQMLLDNDLLSESQLKSALDRQRETGEILGAVLVNDGYLDEATLLPILVDQYGVPSADLDNIEIDPEIANMVPQDMARRYLLVPMASHGESVDVAMVDPTDFVAMAHIRFATGLRPNVFISTVTAVERALARVYSGEGNMAEQQQLDPREQVKKMILDRDSLLMAADGDPRKFYELAATIDEFIDEIFRQATE